MVSLSGPIKHIPRRHGFSLYSDPKCQLSINQLMRLIPQKLSIILILSAFWLEAQELPPIQNYSPTDYDAGNQNWAIAQSEDRVIYIANNEGLLEFNGSVWKLHPSPNETIMRSVASIDNRIYTGCYMEFGYWEKDITGELKYSSISQTLGIELIEDEEFWNIYGIEEWVVFQSLNRIYIYHEANETIQIIENETRIIRIFNVDGDLYFQRIHQGIFKLINGNETLLINDPIVQEDEVVSILPDQNQLTIITKTTGVLKYNNEGVLLSKIKDQIADLSIYSGIQLRNKNLAIGTISNGLIILNTQYQVIQNFDREKGLLNNTILSIFEDIDGNIWLGLDNGISYININAPLKYFDDTNGMLGSVYATAIFEDNLYLGTNQGLFYRPIKGTQPFNFIEGTEGQVWYLAVLKDQLFCGHHKGTFIVKNGTANVISSIQGTWKVAEIPGEENALIQGNYDGLYLLNKQDDNWSIVNKIEGFDNSARHFDILGNLIFVNHEYQGVFILKADENYSRVKPVAIDTILRGANSGITKYQNDILYAYKKGIFKYNPVQKKFERDSILSTIYTEDNYISGKIIANDLEDEFWIFTTNSLSLISAGNFERQPKIRMIPLPIEVRRDVEEYENIIPMEDVGQYLLGTSTGYIIVDLDSFFIQDFHVVIDKIGLGLKDDYSGSGILLNKNEIGSFSSSENDLRFNYYTPIYLQYLQPSFQFQLIGLYDSWSEWSDQSEVLFENLPPGNYTFNVRSKVGNKLSENIATYSFYISKPWYFTNFMVIMYLVSIILFSILMHNIYRAYYKKQQQQLIDANQKELELSRLQNEKEIIKIKNEQLEKEFKSKSNELAASTMSIIKKNEVLNQIKEELSKIDNREVIRPVIKTIDKNLNQEKNWELFQEAFNNVDQEFFKKMKEIHPDLSPNDLKMCAYMRLNLSSKEVAQLINISPKSVEVKRYRLRKKLNLTSNENLSDYILNI